MIYSKDCIYVHCTIQKDHVSIHPVAVYIC